MLTDHGPAVSAGTPGQHLRRRRRSHRCGEEDETPTATSFPSQGDGKNNNSGGREDGSAKVNSPTSSPPPSPPLLRRSGSSGISTSSAPDADDDDEWVDLVDDGEEEGVAEDGVPDGSISLVAAASATATTAAVVDAVRTAAKLQLAGALPSWDGFRDSGLPPSWQRLLLEGGGGDTAGGTCKSPPFLSIGNRVSAAAAGLSGVLYAAPALFEASSPVERAAWAITAALSVVADYFHVHKKSVAHGVDRVWATSMLLATIYRAATLLAWWTPILAVPCVSCFVMASRCKQRREEEDDDDDNNNGHRHQAISTTKKGSGGGREEALLMMRRWHYWHFAWHVTSAAIGSVIVYLLYLCPAMLAQTALGTPAADNEEAAAFLNGPFAVICRQM